MIHSLIRNDVSIDKLKLSGFDFSHIDKSKLNLRVPGGLKYGDNILPCGFTNKGMVKDGLMVDVFNDDKIWIEFNPNQVPIKKVDKILKNDWGISVNVNDMDIHRIDLERTRLMDRTLIEYHNIMRYASAKVKPWNPLGSDTLNFGKGGTLKQFTFYTKVPKENNKIIRGEFKILKKADEFGIYDLKHLHDMETLNFIYESEFNDYLGKKLELMLDDNSKIIEYHDSDKVLECLDIFRFCHNDKQAVKYMIEWIGYERLTLDGWIELANNPIFNKVQRCRLIKWINKTSKKVDGFKNGDYRLDMIKMDIRNLLKFRNVA
jgi:hypothetical protein